MTHLRDQQIFLKVLHTPDFFFFKNVLFFYFERASTSRGGAKGERERERENSKQDPPCQHRADPSLNVTNQEIMAWDQQESDA